MPAYDVNFHPPGHLYLQAASAPAAAGGDGFSLGTAFHDLLDIVNPLQHLPVVSTIYRAITHDTIGPLEKIAGDGLYGGVWGAVSGAADAAFEAVTGKDFGSTMLAWVMGGDQDAPQVAQAPASAPQPVRTAAAPPVAGEAALAGALNARGVDGALSARALFVYRQSQGLGVSPPVGD